MRPLFVGLAPSLLIATMTAGCIAPVRGGSPEPARSLGSGNLRVGGVAELRSVNLLATDNDDLEEGGYVAPILGFNAGVGVTDQLDIEIGVEVPLYLYIIPLPNSVWAGLRAQVVDSDEVVVAIAGRFGGVRTGNDSESSDPERASASFFAGSLSAEFGSGEFRPGATLRYAGYDVSTRNLEPLDTDFYGSVASATVFVRMSRSVIDVTGYVSAVEFSSPNLDDDGRMLTGGASLSFLPGRTEKQGLVYSPQPAPGPR